MSWFTKDPGVEGIFIFFFIVGVFNGGAKRPSSPVVIDFLTFSGLRTDALFLIDGFESLDTLSLITVEFLSNFFITI